MKKGISALASGMLVLATPGMGNGGDSDYGWWQYTYRNIDVTAMEHNAYAVNLARYCSRLDILLTQILNVQTSYRLPTHIYALPAQQIHQYLADGNSGYRIANGEVTILTENERAIDSDYWGVYFGYTSALLAIDGRLRGPEWYYRGLPQVFANTRYRDGRVSLGNLSMGDALQLGRRALIPLRSFLTTGRNELSAANSNNRDFYDSQAWALAHEIFIERWHRSEFDKYLDMLRHGSAEPAAFAASFSLTYEQLDTEFAAVLHRQNLVYYMKVPQEGVAAGALAQPVPPAELKGRQALLSVRFKMGPDAGQLAGEALQVDPANETAFRALAYAQLKSGEFAQSLASVDKLSTPQASAAALIDSARILESLSEAVEQSKASLSVDAVALRLRARQNYERVLVEDGENRQAREGLARLTPQS